MNKLIGKTVEITAEDNMYYGFTGQIIRYDGRYHVSGGTFSVDNSVAPVFNRNEFKLVDPKQFRIVLLCNDGVVKSFEITANNKTEARKRALKHTYYKQFNKMYNVLKMNITE